jgi:hypothetical protein
MMEQHTLPPDPHPQDVMDAVWPMVAPIMTPSTLGAMALTIAITHAFKLLAESLGSMDDTRDSWIAFCTLTSICVGLIVGTGAWIQGVGWFIIPLCAFGSGLVWRLLQALLPAKVADVLMTATDRRFRHDV